MKDLYLNQVELVHFVAFAYSQFYKKSTLCILTIDQNQNFTQGKMTLESSPNCKIVENVKYLVREINCFAHSKIEDTMRKELCAHKKKF